ncbi:ethylmalonyl-CoA decarboxylase isoform X2 [Rousettus aegyptiacus]|uniref:ethylmalonyl-CoA decarboxylase isoform X2 n=1 Tax=Rousettus aegyptiacus TaxID=9407 RepID=UPI00168D5C82|nr:ethylmalonyl-CoA decarboxylase isoform X2 [Rousettus aegyptiacus]
MARSLLKTSLMSMRTNLVEQTGLSLYNTSHGFDEEEVKKKLQQFPGGSIDLRKEDNGIGILTLNNPSKMNAISGVMMLQLLEKVIELENWTEGKGLIVHGANNTFSSGSDLNVVKALVTPEHKTFALCLCVCAYSYIGWNSLIYVHAKHLNKINETSFNKYCAYSRLGLGWRSRIYYSM